MDRFLDHLLGRKSKKTAICILKDHTEILFLTKELDGIQKRTVEKVNALIEIEEKKSQEIWKEIENKLIEKSLISKKESLSYRNGIMYTAE